MSFLTKLVLIKLVIVLILGLVFMAYFNPTLIVDIANNVLTLCGW